ncbi:hypothetical protein DFA_10249 [Cavenderia fasciculata]|uniref:Transmembrane protein n=1 Tax=Cavenderia fasciculata TaxID=261658 RepID=F4Q9P5_CACFS|nr:uncharacterized protein DFA_10249 [Cavenderia fasciculata]EGG15414.1 hypothetical protein DFA_10249 [Cavenderia fasciculata]|eukprot:XP_004354156.1 hypothetical protein DFA_10249 [Cavenderia fasciculata]
MFKSSTIFATLAIILFACAVAQAGITSIVQDGKKLTINYSPMTMIWFEEELLLGGVDTNIAPYCIAKYGWSPLVCNLPSVPACDSIRLYGATGAGGSNIDMNREREMKSTLNDSSKTVERDGKKVTLSFQDRVQDQFIELVSDFFYTIMLIITVFVFPWRAKQTLFDLKISAYDEWKDIIGTEFYEGGTEFCSFMGLLLLNWPVVFKTLWYLNTEHEDKSTWAQIFYREFVEKNIKKDDKELDKEILINPTTTSTTTTTTSANTKQSPNTTRKTKSDVEWKSDFRRDLQNIGFEFDSNGEISKFPPTEVMEEYQRSTRFKDLILSAGSGSSSSSSGSGSGNKDDIHIKDISQHQAEQQLLKKQQQQQMEKEKEKEIQIQPKQKHTSVKKKKNK